MLRSRFFRATLAVALVFAASSCDSADLIQAPTDAAPQFGVGNGKATGHGHAPGQTKKIQDLLATAMFDGGTSAATITREGGVLEASATVHANSPQEATYTHILLISKNAVRQDTDFRMEVVSDHFIGVDLYAATSGSPIYDNDVGSAGFRRPLTLCLSVEASGMESAQKELTLAWWTNPGDGVPDAFFVPVPTYPMEAGGERFLCGNVDHFSRFVVIHN